MNLAQRRKAAKKSRSLAVVRDDKLPAGAWRLGGFAGDAFHEELKPRPPLLIGISACLLGWKVRYDGGHKRNDSLMKRLRRRVEWVPVCPEVEMGLGTPRNKLRLVRQGGEVRLVMPSSGEDYTAQMRDYARRRVEQLAREGLCGFVLKKNSPSCGAENVKAFDRRGRFARRAQGLFAEALLKRLPRPPVEEEDRLQDPKVLQDFLHRALAYQRAHLAPRRKGIKAR